MSSHSLARARAAAALLFDGSAQVVTKTRSSDGAGGQNVTGESLGTAFPCSFAPVEGEEGEEFLRATGNTLYGLFFPHSVVLARTDVLKIGGVYYDLVMTSCDQTQADLIQHYGRMVRR